ncbi:MAG: vWA domain-containing protein [Bacteroidales bacterium]|nr:vWA domain-containing protein [Bacteroidales bacterium]
MSGIGGARARRSRFEICALEWLLLLLLVCIPATMPAQGYHNAKATLRKPDTSQEKTRVLLILDCSSSMWERWQSNAKIKVTQTVLLKFLDSVANQPNFEVALRVFGHLNKDAYGTKLEVPFEKNNNYKIQSKIKTLVPKGGCTIDQALTHSLNDFPAASDARNIIVVITDGIDDSDGHICQVAQQVQMSGVVVQTFLLGIGGSGNFDSRIGCAGKFTYVPNEEQYTQTLYNIFSLSGEEARVVLQATDATNHLFEASIPVTFYDAQTGLPRFSTCYNVDGNFMPDTLTVDPLVSYDIVFHTHPETATRGLQFAAGRTTRINVSIEQGNLRLQHEVKRTALNVPSYPVLVRRHGDNAVLNVQQMGEQKGYLAGTYDVEILSIPTLRLEGITVQPNANIDLGIPLPGMLNLVKPRGSWEGNVLSYANGKMTRVSDIDAEHSTQRIFLLPGTYEVILHPAGSSKYGNVVKKRFTIEAGLQTNVSF